MTCILAIDSTSETCSAALYDETVVISRSHKASRGHGDVILEMIRQLLYGAGYAKSAIDVLAFGRGPGAFTSLRVGAGIIQGLAVGIDRPVVAVSSLAALAHGAFRTLNQRRTLVAIDARMAQVYHAAYETCTFGSSILYGEEQVSAPEKMNSPDRGWSAVGNGWQVYKSLIPHCQDLEYLGAGVEDSALDIAYLSLRDWNEGRAVSPELALPVYIRDKVVHKNS